MSHLCSRFDLLTIPNQVTILWTLQSIGATHFYFIFYFLLYLNLFIWEIDIDFFLDFEFTTCFIFLKGKIKKKLNPKWLGS